jgi:hypothetical protein
LACHPESFGDFEWSDLEIGPPRNLMAEAVQFAMMLTTKWHGELIAHLES